MTRPWSAPARRVARPLSPTKFFRPRLEPLEDRAVPATFNVTTTLDVVDPADRKRSLREATTAANNLAGADVIVMPVGVYKLAGGDLDITDTVTIAAAGRSATIIDGQKLDRVFDILGTAPGSIKVVLQGMSIRNGLVTGPGGGILVGNADLVVRDSAITDHHASGDGGGISNGSRPASGNVKIVRTNVARNTAGASGGGLSVSGNPSVLTVRDSTVRRNVASSVGGGIRATTATLTGTTVSSNVAGGNGGGLFSNTATLAASTVNGNISGNSGGGMSVGTATLTRSTVSDNRATEVAGGINASTANVTFSTVSGNTAGVRAGGINASTANVTSSTVSGNGTNGSGGGIFSATPTLTNSTVSGNTAGSEGGGILATGTSTLTNCTVSGNSAGNRGGGISAVTATLTNCTVAENLAFLGGGLYRSNIGADFNLRNTIVAMNLVLPGGTGPDVAGDAFTSQGHNLIGVGNASFSNGANSDLVGTIANPIDAKLGPLANNGGPARTHALLAGSLAVDGGDNNSLPPTDQRGLPRRRDGNGDGLARVDIGAFER